MTQHRNAAPVEEDCLPWEIRLRLEEEDARYAYEERAAILEYEAGLDRRTAELRAKLMHPKGAPRTG